MALVSEILLFRHGTASPLKLIFLTYVVYSLLSEQRVMSVFSSSDYDKAIRPGVGECPPQNSPLCYIMLRYVTLRYVTFCYVTFRYVLLRYVTLRTVVHFLVADKQVQFGHSQIIFHMIIVHITKLSVLGELTVHCSCSGIIESATYLRSVYFIV